MNTDSGEGKGADELNPYWRRLNSSRVTIDAVAMDRSAAYVFAVTGYLPEAVIVFDKFHVVKLMNEKLSELRRQLYREATDRLDKDVLSSPFRFAGSLPWQEKHFRSSSE